MQFSWVRGDSGLERNWERKPFSEIFLFQWAIRSPLQTWRQTHFLALNHFLCISHNTGPGTNCWLHTKCGAYSLHEVDCYLAVFWNRKVTTTKPHALNPLRLQDEMCYSLSLLLFASRGHMWKLTSLCFSHTSWLMAALNRRIITVGQDSYHEKGRNY